MRTVREWIPFLLFVLIAAACQPSASMGELPDRTSWEGENAQPSEGVQLSLVIDYVVGNGFDPAFIEVSVDGVGVVSGVGQDRPDEHCNWYGPYVLRMEPGSHRLEARTDTGLDIDVGFEISSDSMGLVRYVDPSYGGYDETPEPHIVWDYIPDQGFLGCL